MASDSKSSARLTCTLTLTELSQELGEGGGGEVVGLVRIATKVIQGFIYLKLNYLSSGAPTPRHRQGGWVLGVSGSGARQKVQIHSNEVNWHH